MVVKVYVEGGGDFHRLQRACRRGFGRFLERAGLAGRMPGVVASGSRKSAYDSFRSAIKRSAARDFIVLLVDSEERVAHFGKPWKHLRDRPRDKWVKPSGATDENAHLMVVCMETWFLADVDTLEEFYGHEFNTGALPKNPNLEEIVKSDVMDGLENATRPAFQKGTYSKGRHSFEILERLDPVKVCAASRHAERFVETLRDKTLDADSR